MRVPYLAGGVSTANQSDCEGAFTSDFLSLLNATPVSDLILEGHQFVISCCHGAAVVVLDGLGPSLQTLNVVFCNDNKIR